MGDFDCFASGGEYHIRKGCPVCAAEGGRNVGAAVAFGLMGMAEAIRENYPDHEMPPCKSCGRLLLAGGFCCYRSAMSAYGEALGERDHARKLQGKEAKKAAKWMKAYQETMEMLAQRRASDGNSDPKEKSK